MFVIKYKCVIFDSSVSNESLSSMNTAAHLLLLFLVLLPSLPFVWTFLKMGLSSLFWLSTLLTKRICLLHSFKAFILNRNLSKEPVKHLPSSPMVLQHFDCNQHLEHFIGQLTTYTQVTHNFHETILSFYFPPILFHLKIFYFSYNSRTH